MPVDSNQEVILELLRDLHGSVVNNEYFEDLDDILRILNRLTFKSTISNNIEFLTSSDLVSSLIHEYIRKDVYNDYGETISSRSHDSGVILENVLEKIFKFSALNNINLQVIWIEATALGNTVPIEHALMDLSSLSALIPETFNTSKYSTVRSQVLYDMWKDALGSIHAPSHIQETMDDFKLGKINISKLRSIVYSSDNRADYALYMNTILDKYASDNKHSDDYEELMRLFARDLVNFQKLTCTIDDREVNCLEKYIALYKDNKIENLPYIDGYKQYFENCKVGDTTCIDVILSRAFENPNERERKQMVRQIVLDTEVDLVQKKCKVKSKDVTCAEKIILGADEENQKQVLQHLFERNHQFKPIMKNGMSAVSLVADIIKKYKDSGEVFIDPGINAAILDSTSKNFEKYKLEFKKKGVDLCSYFTEDLKRSVVFSKDSDDKLREFSANLASCKCGYNSNIKTKENTNCLDKQCILSGIENASSKHDTMDSRNEGINKAYGKMYFDLYGKIEKPDFYSNRKDCDKFGMLGVWQINSPKINGGVPLYFVISNAQSDIYRASSCQDWTSCINVARGFNSYALPYYDKYCSYIGYLADHPYGKWKARVFIHTFKKHVKLFGEKYPTYAPCLQPPYGLNAQYKQWAGDVAEAILYEKYFSENVVDEDNYIPQWEKDQKKDIVIVWVDERKVRNISDKDSTEIDWAYGEDFLKYVGEIEEFKEK